MRQGVSFQEWAYSQFIWPPFKDCPPSRSDSPYHKTNRQLWPKRQKSSDWIAPYSLLQVMPADRFLLSRPYRSFFRLKVREVLDLFNQLTFSIKHHGKCALPRSYWHRKPCVLRILQGSKSHQSHSKMAKFWQLSGLYPRKNGWRYQ